MRKSPLTTAILLLTPYTAHAANHPCSLPAILHVSRSGADLIYQVNDHAPHRLYTLGEVSDAVRDCKAERVLFVVASPEVPVGSMVVPSKEQIEHVRYFVQFAANDFWELGTDHYFYTLPVTPDILPQPSYDDTTPSAVTKPKGLK